jgi:hypothetical protein
MPSWCGAHLKIKHRDNFTFTFTFTLNGGSESLISEVYGAILFILPILKKWHWGGL